jgi:iron complex transport system permease protein
MLGIVGASFQSLFRNPLAEPYTVGVSSGAAVGGVLSLVLGWSSWFGGLGTMALAVVGGLLSLMLVFGLAQRRGVIDVPSLLLGGVVIGSLLAALTTLILYLAGEDTNRVLGWLLGSMTPMLWERVLILSIVLLIGTAILLIQGRKLNAFAIDETVAQHLGINTSRLKWVVLLTGTAMASVCVGAVGIIGFLGLVSPHIARRLLGVDWRMSMPGALMIGPMLLLIADMLSQRVIAGIEIPVGAVTALIGAPFLLVLLRRESKLA